MKGRSARAAARLAFAAALALVAALAPAAPARADPTDTFGFSARAAALGAFVAISDDAAAAMYNPAGAAFAARDELALGYGAGDLDLRLNGRDPDLSRPRGLSLALLWPFSVGTARGATDIALYLPDQFAARLSVLPAEEPRFVLLDNDVHRVVFAPTVALAPHRRLALGGGVTMLADAAGNGVRFSLNDRGGRAQGESALDVELPTRAAPVLGALWRPRDDLRLGAAWRGAIDLRIRLDVVADIELGAVAQGDSIITVRSVNFYTPHRVAAGAAWQPAPALLLAAELVYLRWSAFSGSVADIRTAVNLQNAPALVFVDYPEGGFSDVWSPRAGLEHRGRLGGLDAAWRAGYRFEPTPVPAQTGVTSLADNDRHVFALGGGITAADPAGILPGPVSLDAVAQWHHLVERRAAKADPSGPTRDLTSGGRILHGAVTVTVRF